MLLKSTAPAVFREKILALAAGLHSQ
jgi:hypothetical protein